MARRPRREVDTRVLKVLSPLFRYSESRRAWVLRGVGGVVGPKLIGSDRKGRREPEPALRPGRPARHGLFRRESEQDRSPEEVGS